MEERLEKFWLDMEQAKIEYDKPFQYEEERSWREQDAQIPP